ncbi:MULTISPECIES: diguanylate cyclase [unclassified Stenotrophomonas]|uniref:GGDEF domain-containing protein n=1 Tax=unclassified Stenotrophomonas TaxID=196198 RepID=UPI0021186773|nr:MULTISPECIES: diguanylate cyclase [unclassified Stenotrophomonas]
MSLDFPTVAVLGYLLCLGIALGFSLLLLVLRGQPALRLWTASLWLLALSLTSVALRAQLPVVPLVIFGNAVLALSAVAMLYGVARHLQRRLPSWQPVLLAGAYVAGIVVFVVPFPNLAVRLNVASLFSVLVNGWMAWMLVRHAPPEQRTSCWLAAAIFGAEAMVYLVRLWLPVAPDAGQDIFRAGAPMFATYLAGIFLELARCFALVLLLVEKMLVDLRRVARTDGLTGLLNRGAVLADGQACLQQCQRQQQPLALLLLDVDHFKQVNDRWGHIAGDQVLRHFATVLSSSLAGQQPLLGRYGGEEFVLLLPGADHARATQHADHIRAQLQACPACLGDVPVMVTTSIGLAVGTGAHDLAALLAAADRALYQAKADGRDRTVSAVPVTA